MRHIRKIAKPDARPRAARTARTRWRSFTATLGISAVIAIFCLALIGAIWGVVIVQAHKEREKAIADAIKQNSNLAAAFEEHTIRMLKGVDAATLYIAHEYARLGAKTNLSNYVAEGLIDSKLLIHVTVVDERGDVVLSSGPFNQANIADREPFLVHAREDSGKLFIGKPLLSRITGKWSIPITRRINRPDGSFAGITATSIDPQYLIDFYQKADLGDKGLVTLVGLDGITRARRSGHAASFGQQISNTTFFKEQAKSANGHFLSRGSNENIPRFISYRTLSEYPLVVAVGTSQAEILAEISKNKRNDYLAASLFSVTVVFFSALLIAALRRQKRAVAALAANHAQFRATFEQAAVGIAHAALDGRYLRVNQKFCNILGYSKEELLERTFFDVSHPDDRPLSTGLRTQLQADDTQTLKPTREKRYIAKSGATVWAAISVSLLRKPNGEPDYFVIMMQDITDRKQAEERFRATFEQAAVGICHTAPDGRLLQVNEKLCDMLGYTRGELLAMTTYDITPAEDHGIDVKRRAQLVSGETKTYAAERRCVRKDGAVIWVNRTVSIVRDAAGATLYFIRVMEDISERKRAESALRKQTGLRILLESLAVAANQAATTEQALRACLSRICSYGNWPVGHVVMFGDAAYSMGAQTSLWHLRDAERYAEFKRISDPLVMDPGSGGFLTRCMESRRPVWITSLAELEHFKRKEVALRLGLTSGFAFPVTIGNRVVACLEFFSELALEPDNALLEVTTNIGAQLGRVAERRQAEHALRESEEQFQQLAGNIPQMCWITDASQRKVVYLSPAFETVTGYAIDAAKASPRVLVKIVHPDDRRRVQAARGHAASGGYDETYRLVRPDGSIRWVHDRAFPIRHPNGEIYRIAGIAEDITERKHSEERVLHLAHHDALTTLPNRKLFYDRLEHALEQAQRRNWTTGVMFVDLDGFKAVNDTLGHGVGDQVLQQAASRLTQCVRAEDTVGRLGGDEFAVILSELAHEQAGSVVAQKIIDTMAKPFLVDSHEVFITASIGIATCLPATSNADTLMSNADAAMYDAKKLGKNNYQFYTAAMNERSMQKLLLEKDLRNALARDEFVLHFQPKANLRTGRITGVEALLRWQRPDGRLVMPLEFIPMLEESGLIVLAGEWVLRAACAQLRGWQQEGITPVPIAVNLSAKQFHQQDIVAMVMRALLEYDINPALLELEITESAAMHDAKATSATLHKLKALGVRIAIDDFGTGYSSLSYLKRFPIDSLKIDRSFVTELPGNQEDASIAQAVITMAHALRLKVVAEGVENDAQLEFLAAHTCDEMQGYYFSHPLPAAVCMQFLKEQRKLPSRPAHERGVEPRALAIVTSPPRPKK